MGDEGLSRSRAAAASARRTAAVVRRIERIDHARPQDALEILRAGIILLLKESP